jgi:peptidoglycan/xylan/chitin deacetylase (PgdA/CDA1 family)
MISTLLERLYARPAGTDARQEPDDAALQSCRLMRCCLPARCAGLALALLPPAAGARDQAPAFRWPEGARAALSLSFDDARASQVGAATAVLGRFGAKATFFVVPSSVERQLAGWKKVVAAGHEIGNHSSTHPCSGNFDWARDKALEDYTLERMRGELHSANQRIKELLDVTPRVFAYPCGQAFVGRGLDTKSYVPLVAASFLAGRGWLDEEANDPGFCDLAQLLGVEMDGKDFDELRPALERAKQAGRWLVLAGHEVGESGRQTTRVRMLEELLAYARDPANGLWLAPVGTVADYVRERRERRP